MYHIIIIGNIERNNNILLDNLEHLDVLEIGSFGRVTLVRDRTTSLAYALKNVSKDRAWQEEHIINEKRVLTVLDSSILSFHYICLMIG